MGQKRPNRRIGGEKSLACSLCNALFRCASLRSAALLSVSLRSTSLHFARRSAHGLIREWESGDVLMRPHASICADSTHGASSLERVIIRMRF